MESKEANLFSMHMCRGIVESDNGDQFNVAGKIINGFWTYGFYAEDSNGNSYIIKYITFREYERGILTPTPIMLTVIRETVQRCAGYKDKLDNLVYYGDIVSYKTALGFDEEQELSEARVVRHSVGIVEIEGCVPSPRPYRDNVEDIWYSEGAFDFEVIGTIFDVKESE